MHTNLTKMIYSKSKEERCISSELQFREPSAETEQIIAGICNANGIKAMKHILIPSRSEEGTLNKCEKYNSWRLLQTLNESNAILTESKPKVQKILICSKSREGTAESSGAARISNTSVEVQ